MCIVFYVDGVGIYTYILTLPLKCHFICTVYKSNFGIRIHNEQATVVGNKLPKWKTGNYHLSPAFSSNVVTTDSDPSHSFFTITRHHLTRKCKGCNVFPLKHVTPADRTFSNSCSCKHQTLRGKLYLPMHELTDASG